MILINFSLTLDLKTGVIMPCFKSDGKSLVTRDMFMKTVS